MNDRRHEHYEKIHDYLFSMLLVAALGCLGGYTGLHASFLVVGWSPRRIYHRLLGLDSDTVFLPVASSFHFWIAHVWRAFALGSVIAFLGVCVVCFLRVVALC